MKKSWPEKHYALVALGQRIRELREQAGFYQDDFAAAASISRAFYGRIERGERNISMLTLLKIAVTLKLEVGEVFPKTHELAQLISKFEDKHGAYGEA